MAALILLSLFFGTQSIHAIWNGTPAPEEKNTVFSLHRHAYTSGSNTVSGGHGSSTAVRYRRCLLTANHVVSPLHNYMAAFMGPVVGTGSKYQKKQGSTLIDPYSNPYRDLAVLWLENKTDTNNIALSDYDPIEIASISDLYPNDTDFPGWQESTSGTLNFEDLLPNNYKLASFWGFGNSASGALDYGTLRKGDAVLHMYHDYTNYQAPTLGSTLILTQSSAIDWGGPNPVPTANSSADSGDSGGPLRLPAGDLDKVYGVNAAVLDIIDGRFSIMSTLERDNRTRSGTIVREPFSYADFGNFDAVNIAIEETCNKYIHASTRGVVLGGGNVVKVGQIHGELDSGANDIIPNAENLNMYNGKMRCDVPGVDQDCEETMRDKPGQKMVLDATPIVPSPIEGETYVFDQWMGPTLSLEEPNSQELCWCVGQGAHCEVPYDKVGQYGPDLSSDTEHCLAVFKLVPSEGECDPEQNVTCI